MKVSLNWLRDYVKIPAEISLKKLAYDLTMSTVEVEEVKELANNFDNIVVGVVEEILPHPNADKLKICKTNLGKRGIVDIVCGGSNLERGMKTAVALEGAYVRWHGEGELIQLKKTAVRGVESEGMICASSEIGLADLFPAQKDAEIINITDIDAQAGTPLAEALAIDDTVLVIDNKSLTNRPDLWGHYGIARELATIYNVPLESITPTVELPKHKMKIEIADSSLCRRYIGAKIEGLGIKDTSFEIKKRLWAVGICPINAIVDISNYVMMALGQPTHTFDADAITGGITIRPAVEGEKIALLNKKTLTLSSESLVIADDAAAVCIAGVMGGIECSVLPTTNSIILEVANFDAMSVRRSMMRYDLRTESAIRYEKAIDPERCDAALSMFLTLLKHAFPSMNVVSYTDCYPNPQKRVNIEFSHAWLESRLGTNIQEKEVERILTSLGFDITITKEVYNVTAPSWRSTGDISLPEDVLEEIARIYGYENFEFTPITTSFTEGIIQLDKDVTRKLKEYLAFRCGMQEIFTYPWMHTKHINLLGLDTTNMLTLSEPVSPDEVFIRGSLLPNMLQSVMANHRHFNEFMIFETAKSASSQEFVSKYDKRERLPLEKEYIAGAFVSPRTDITKAFRLAKGIIENAPRYVHFEEYSLRQIEKPSWADESVWLNVVSNNNVIGNLALLGAKATLECGMSDSFVILFEINLEELKPFASRTNTYKQISNYPITKYDLSMLFDANTKWQNIKTTIEDFAKGNDILQDIQLVDEYRGTQVATGKKSISMRLFICPQTKTLTMEEINQFATSIIQHLQLTFGAQLR